MHQYIFKQTAKRYPLDNVGLLQLVAQCELFTSRGKRQGAASGVPFPRPHHARMPCFPALPIVPASSADSSQPYAVSPLEDVVGDALGVVRMPVCVTEVPEYEHGTRVWRVEGTYQRNSTSSAVQLTLRYGELLPSGHSSVHTGTGVDLQTSFEHHQSYLEINPAFHLCSPFVD